MKNLLLFIFSILLLSACDQENINDNIAENPCGLELENIENYDCAIGHYADIEEIESVISEEEEARYLEIWKDIFFKKTGMTEAYFDAHFLNVRAYASEWNTGITLNVVYDYKLDWLEFSHSDKLLIYMKSSVSAYQHHNIPRDTLLDESWVEFIIDNEIANTRLVPVQQIDELAFPSCNGATDYLRSNNDLPRLLPKSYTFWVAGKFPRIDGYPYMMASGIENPAENECSFAYINLFDKSNHGYTNVCCIID